MSIYKFRNVLKYSIVFIICAAICLILSSCFLLPEEEKPLAAPLKQPKKINYETYKVSRGIIENSINATGYIMPEKSENLQFNKLSGRISSIMFSDGDKVKKGDVMAELDTYDIKLGMRKQEIYVRMAEIDLSSAKKSGNSESVEKARLALELARLDLSVLKDQLDMAQLKAPFDGIVTYCKRISAGENVDAYDVIYTVADPTRKMVKYTGDKAEKFIAGMQVLIRIANKNYKATVSSGPADAPDLSMKDVAYVTCDELPDSVKLGMDVFINLSLEKREGVLYIPSNLVKTYSGRTFVKVMKDGLIEERDVVIGLVTPTNTEIVSGLKENEDVVVW